MGLKHPWNKIKLDRDFMSKALCAQGNVFISGVWTRGGKKKKEKDLIFMSHWGLYGEVNPRVLCRGWYPGLCQFRVEMSNYQTQHMYNDLFICHQTLSLCLSSASISIAWRAHIHHTHTYYKLFKWALCLRLGRVNRKCGGEGRQRAGVLEESEEGVQMNRGAAVKCSD